MEKQQNISEAENVSAENLEGLRAELLEKKKIFNNEFPPGHKKSIVALVYDKKTKQLINDQLKDHVYFDDIRPIFGEDITKFIQMFAQYGPESGLRAKLTAEDSTHVSIERIDSAVEFLINSPEVLRKFLAADNKYGFVQDLEGNKEVDAVIGEQTQ